VTGRAVNLAVALAVAGVGGCATVEPATTTDDDQAVAAVDPGWLLRQGLGQLEVLLAARPIAPIIADERVAPDVRRRLAIAVAARDFARDRLGLHVTNQYRTAVFLDAPAVVYVVSAAPRDDLTPRTWSYPVVGALPYRGHFSLEDAEAEADALESDGFDVSVRPVTTYSLLGLAPDPVLSSMLWRRQELDIVETVIHELAHATIFAPGAGAFNEGLASFIGREGRRQFVRERFGQGAAVAIRADADDRDDDAWTRAVSALAFDLRVLFAQRSSRSQQDITDEKRRIFGRHQRHWREEVAGTLFSMRLREAQLPENNAALAAVGIYSLKQHLYTAAFDSCGNDWRCFLNLMATVSHDDDPETSLAERLGTSSRDLVIE
jgi:predicted aminopeptidase